MSIDIKDYTAEVESAINSQIEVALETIGLLAEGYAKKLTPVDTGNLRNSITHAHDDKSVVIGTNVEYAPFVELGTSKMHEQPYLRPAVQDHLEQYKQVVKKYLHDA